MKILFISNLYPNPYQTHRAPWNRQQIAALAKQHDVHAISPLSWTDELRWRRSQGNLLPQTRRVECDSITVDHPRYYFPPKVARSLYGGFYRHSITNAFQTSILEFQPEVVLAAWAYPDGWAATQLAHQSGVPCVLKVHGSDILLLDDFQGRRQKTIEALQAASSIVAVSQDLAREMEQLGIDAQKITVVYNGVDTNHFSPGLQVTARKQLSLPVDTSAILYVGNLLPVKGIERLVKAAAQLMTRGEKFHLHIIGDGPERESLQQQIRQLALVDHVTFHGPKPHAELPNWFRAANVFCLPSRSEGVPNVLLESAACGTPFVAFDVGGISEIAHLGTSTLVQKYSPEHLAPALQKHLQMPPNQVNKTFRSFDDSATELAAVLDKAIGGEK